MSTLIKTPEQIAGIRESAKRLADVIQKVSKKIAPGVTAKELDDYAFELITEKGDRPSFLHYRPQGVKTPYPASLCVSINDEVVHGIPSADMVLRDGDIVTLDCGINHNGYFSDHAITFPVGDIDAADQKLINITREALMVGIKAAQPGNTTGDIGHAIEKFVDGRYGIVRILAGHGVGLSVHEDPFIPNFGKPKTGDVLKPGMVIAIEPMLNRGTEVVDVL
nr:type I methionyl aminopeptidase [Candidatus Paceibacterota bacterium]